MLWPYANACIFLPVTNESSSTNLAGKAGDNVPGSLICICDFVPSCISVLQQVVVFGAMYNL